MAGDSIFWIITRVPEAGNLTSDCVVCFINKELDSSRKFINFAILEENEQDSFLIKTLKKQEIPKHENYNKNSDVSEIKIVFIDNGDNKCFVTIENGK